MASGTGTCHSLLPKCWQVHLTLRSHCFLSASLLVSMAGSSVGHGREKRLAHSIFVLISGRIMNHPLKSIAHPLDGDGELSWPGLGHLALSIARARTSLTRLKVQKAVAPSILENLEKMCAKKKKPHKKPYMEDFSKTLWQPLGEGIPMKRVPIYWVLVLGHRSYTMHCRQYNALHTLSCKSCDNLDLRWTFLCISSCHLLIF